MATKDYKRLTESEIVKMVEDNIKTSVGYYDSDLSRERKKVTEYYNASLPKPAHDGNSKYVSQDVYDAVQSMSAALLETFSSGSRIIRFAPQGPEDVKLAEVCSAYTDYQLFRKNDGFSIFRDVIFDGLTSRVGVAKVFWQEMFDEVPEEFEGITADELDMLLAEDDIELDDSESNDIGLLSGTVLRRIDKSKVCIESIPPEEFIIEPQARNLDDVNFCAHRTRKTISELREMGFDDDKIDDIGNHDDLELDTDPEVLARHEDIGSDRGFNAHGYQDQVRSILVYEAYIMLDVEGTGTAKLHKVFKAGNTVLDMEEVDRRPFIAFAPLPKPHSFFGSNFAEKICATQNARTVLTRSILDHAMITNNPRYMVVKGSLTSPRELIDNRVGGIVNVSRPDGISPMPQAPLNPFVFQTLQQLQDNSEENTGVSSLTTGMNKDAVSKQNSAALVEQLATMSQQRQKIIARQFSIQFVKPLFLEIYRLCVENETQEKIFEVAGDYVTVDPAAWSDQRDVMVELHLGYGEQDREAQKLMQLHTMFSQDPTLQPMYSAQNRYQLMKKMLEAQGILNVEDYLTPPDKLPPPQPDPAQQMQQQMAMKQMELQERQTAVAEARAQNDQMATQNKVELDLAKAEAQHAIQSDNQDLREAQFAHKQRIDEGELEMLRTTEDKRGIVSPTG